MFGVRQNVTRWAENGWKRVKCPRVRLARAGGGWVGGLATGSVMIAMITITRRRLWSAHGGTFELGRAATSRTGRRLLPRHLMTVTQRHRQSGRQGCSWRGCSGGFYFILMIAMFSTRLHINILHCHKNSLIVYKCFIGWPTLDWGQWWGWPRVSPGISRYRGIRGWFMILIAANKQ